MITEKHIPAEPDSFVGRERDVEDLCRLLDTARLVTLCGPGGIGKTRLALRVAHTVTAPAAWFVELAELAEVKAGSDGALVRRVAQTVGVTEEPGRDLTDTLAAALRDRPGLLVLDTCEHLVDDCAELARRLLAVCPKLRLFATSREPLRISGENVWRVPPLELPAHGDPPEAAEAVRLFAARAATARAGFVLTAANAPAVAAVCRTLDGVPLALELAAARMRVLSVEQLAARLVDRFGLLSAGARTAPGRQRTLRAAVDWSHDLLGEPEKILLRRLSVFSGWTIDPAERVCADDDLPAVTVLDALTALVDKSLVVVEREVASEIRFRMLDSIREYAAERLDAAGEAAELRARHRDWMLERAEAESSLIFGYRKSTWAEKVRLLQRHHADQDNIRAALAWSVERGEIAEGLRLCTVLRMHGSARGEFAEWIGWIQGLLERAEGVDPAVTGAATVALAEMGIESRDLDLAASAAARGVALLRSSPEGRAAAGLHAAALTALWAGRLSEADDLTAQALAEAVAAGDSWNEGLVTFSRAAVRAARGAGREARELCEQGIRLMHSLDHRWGVSRGQIVLGTFARARRDHAAARDHFTLALPPLRQIGALQDLARALAGLARAALGQGDLPAARDALTESLELNRGMGLRLGVARCLESCAELHAAEGDHRSAVLVAGAAAALHDELGRASGSGARLETMLEPVRRALGEPLVAKLWGEGRALSLECAVTLALTTSLERGPAPVPVPGPRSPAHDAAGDQPSSRPATPTSTLTHREREIAQLIVHGHSNKSIAGELVISPATVARHVTNILTKLGFSSRAQIAAWYVDNDLD